MDNIQYTIRGIPKQLDKVLRLRAKKRSQSFNTLLVETLQRGATIASSPTRPKNKLDWFYGSGGIDEVEKQTFASQRLINPKDWPAK